MTPAPARITLLLAIIAVGACNGSPTAVDGVPEIFVSKGAPTKTHLRGQIVDINTLRPIEGVVVEIEGNRSVTTAEGHYNLQNLRVGATELSTSKAGYIGGITILPLNGGDQEFNIRLRPE